MLHGWRICLGRAIAIWLWSYFFSNIGFPGRRPGLKNYIWKISSGQIITRRGMKTQETDEPYFTYFVDNSDNSKPNSDYLGYLPMGRPNIKTSPDVLFDISDECSSMLKVVSTLKGRLKIINSARHELGISTTGYKYSFDFRFYKHQKGIFTINLNGIVVPYVVIWKCGNNAIRNNLREAERTFHRNMRRDPFDIDHNHRAPDEYIHQDRLRKFYNLSELAVSFTFVREPLSHFVSGIREYYWRHNSTIILTTNKLKDKIIGFLKGNELSYESDEMKKSKKPNLIDHVFAMSSVLQYNYNIRYLGKLEHFNKSWTDILEAYGGQMLRFNYNLGLHPTSEDSNNVKRAFIDLFKNDSKFVRALCRILLVDYICFKYQLPPECDGITSAEYINIF